MARMLGHRVLFIGDLHGLTEWRELVLDGLKSFHEVVFLGDYIDSFHVRPVVQLENLKALISFVRKKAKGKATLLLGNHDYAVIHSYSGISGYQHQHAHEYRKIFQDNIDLFQIAWGYINSITKKYTIATHAGLTKSYYYKYILPLMEDKTNFLYQIIKDNKNISIHETLNFLKDKKDLLWKVGSMRGGAGTPGPLWADYQELIEDPYPGINQVFGHTPKVSITIDHIGNEFYACVDSWRNKKIASLILSLSNI